MKTSMRVIGIILGLMLLVPSSRAAVEFSLEIQRGKNANRTYWAPGGEFFGMDVRFTATPVGTTNFMYSPNTNFAWRVGPGDFGPDQVLEGSFGSLYQTLPEVLNELTNGLWTLVLNEGSVTQQIYRFKINQSGITSNDFAFPTITFPADDAENVSTTPSFTWTLPAPVGEVELSFGLANYDFIPLAPNTIGWSRSSPFDLGDTEINVVTKTNAANKIFIGTPTNAAGQPLPGWTSTSKLNTRRTHQFWIGPRPAPSSLIAHLKFENGGFLSEDTSGLFNHPSMTWINNPPIQDPSGVDGSSLSLFADDRGELQWNQSFVSKLARGFSVSAWIKTTQDFGPGDGDWGAGAGIVGAQACCDGRDFAPLVLNGGYILFNTGDGQNSGQTLSSTVTVNDGNWTHLVATREAATGRMRLYINGQLDGTLLPGINAVLDGPGSMSVGSLGNFNNSFEGLIDDVQIYTNAISSAEVLYLFQNPGQTVTGGGSSDSGLGEAVDAPELTWITDSDAPWFSQPVTTYDGVDAAQNGPVDLFGGSWIETTIEGPGELTFRWRLEGEFGVDYVEFYVDDSYETDLSGAADWESYSYIVPPGTHTFRWRYYQDDVPGEGQHAAWLDTVNFTSGAAPVITVHPFAQTNYTGYSVALLAAATGTPAPTWQWHKIGVGPIPGATNALFIPTNSGTPSVAGRYFAVASNLSGSASTGEAPVTFTAGPPPPPWSTAFAPQLYADGFEYGRTNYGIACLLDAAGNLYSANSYTGTNSFGTNVVSSGPGRFGTVLMKQSTNGTPIWARAITNNGNGNSYPQCLVAAPGNGTYVSGVFLGTNWLGTNRLAETAGASVYLARIDADGNILWVRTFGGTNAAFQSYHQLIADSAGNVTISALINTFASFGTTNVTVTGQKGVLAQYDVNGVLRWVQLPSGWVQYLAHSAGRIYGSMANGDTNYFIGGQTNSSDRKWVLVSLNAANGQAQWQQPFGSHQSEGGFRDLPCVAVSGTNVFVLGTRYRSNTVTEPFPVGGVGTQYFERYNTNGAYETGSFFGGENVLPWAAVADADGNVYLGADFDGYAIFGSGPPPFTGNKLVAAPHVQALADGFRSQTLIAKFDRNGKPVWVRHAESQYGYVNMRDLVVAPDGVWACGFTEQPSRFGTFDVYPPSTCIGSPFCFVNFHSGGWLAKITDGAALAPISLINTRLAGANVAFDFLTQTGRSYTVEYRDSVTTGTWQTLTNVGGDGTLKSIVRPAGTPPIRFFRVRQP